jgi:hypothetical protein
MLEQERERGDEAGDAAAAANAKAGAYTRSLFNST